MPPIRFLRRRRLQSDGRGRGWRNIRRPSSVCRTTSRICLLCFQFDDPDFRKTIRTTNAIERRFREVRRRTRPMGVFSDRTSIERILYAVLMYENINQGVYPVFGLTQKS